ncbi:MAG TPA: tetratricopeptide repeat protein [Vicinamibacterales bacterium]
MNLRSLASVAAVAACLAWAGTALARNPHCAGGIQYVGQALRDKDKGNMEDYRREIGKAVDQLSQCAAEDPADFEAIGYLGWALAEVDSAGPAGHWFTKAEAGAIAKGDKKKLETIRNNKSSYWARWFNDGIKNIQDGQAFIEAGSPDKAKAPIEAAVLWLTRADLLNPGHPQTLKSLATAYAIGGNTDAAEAVLRNGIVAAAADTNVVILKDFLKTVRTNKAVTLREAKQYKEAIAYYQDLVRQEPGDASLWSGLGDVHYEAAMAKSDSSRNADMRAAANAYSKAYALNPKHTDSAFNAAQMYQNTGLWAEAEAQWRTVLKVTPDDPEALSSLAVVLSNQKKFAEAQSVALRALELKPDKNGFLSMATVYRMQDNSPKNTEMMFVYLAMKADKPAADAAAAAGQAPAGSAATNTSKAMGAPEKIYNWSADGMGDLQTWMYFVKHQAFTFNKAGALIQKSDWTAAKK